MFQIIFNELSAAEMSALPKKMQLDLLAEFQILPEDLDRLDAKHFGVLDRSLVQQTEDRPDRLLGSHGWIRRDRRAKYAAGAANPTSV